MSKRILVIEDEPDIREVTSLILQRAGYEVDEAGDGKTGLDIALSGAPDAIILDLMIPGLHGFEVIQRVRENDITQSIPIIVLSAKPYPADQRKALKMGANRFILKPFNKDGLLEAIRQEFQRTKVTFWGVRGSIAVPGPETLLFGGNTPCVSVEHGGEMLILDAGTGIRRLGLYLQKTARGNPIDVNLLITHTHWDHIQGFPFFVPAMVPGNNVSIYGPPSVEKPLEKVLRGQMDAQYFPVALSDLASGVKFTELRGETLEIGPFSVSYRYVNHPGVTLGFRIEVAGRVVVYAPDNEPYQHLLSQQHEEKEASREYGRIRDNGLVKLIQDADLAILDSQYTPKEYESKIGWGHSNYLETVDVAIEGNVKRLALFSHDPMHDDAMIRNKLDECHQHADERDSDMEILAAVEGMVLDITELAEDEAIITN